jgi:hypothetical protein
MPVQHSPSSQAWHVVYERLNLGVLNPVCPFFERLSDALRFTGEFLDRDFFIHPARHALARLLLRSPEIHELEQVFKIWKEELSLPGARPFAQGSASLVLDLGASFVLNISTSSKPPPPPLSIVVQHLREHCSGKYRIGLCEKHYHTQVTDEEIEQIARFAELQGYTLEDRFKGNFGRTAWGVLRVLDSDAVKKIS